MSAFFGAPPPVPKIQQPPRPPQVDQAALDADQADMLRRRRGRAADILTGPTGLGSGSGNAGTVALLGQ